MNINMTQNKSFQNKFVSNNFMGQLLVFSSGNFIFLKIFNLEFPCFKVWFCGQNYITNTK